MTTKQEVTAIHGKLDAQQSDLTEIKTALLGNEYGTGLVDKVNKNTKYREKSGKRFALLGGIFTIFGAIIMYVKQYFGY